MGQKRQYFEQTELSQVSRNRGQIVNYSQLYEMLTQNVSKTQNKTFTQYTKELISTYIQNPASNIDTLRDISSFLMRVSMPYKKIIEYFASMPLYSYNISYISKDWSKPIDQNKFMKEYREASRRLYNINFEKVMSTAIASALRDGIYIGYCYDNEDAFFVQALDPKYCKIRATTERDTYVVWFNATYFDSGNNSEFVKGIDGDTNGIWDDVFVDGYNQYKNGGRDYMWFELPPEKTITIISGDDPTLPLPYFLPVFTSLLDLLDLESLIRDKTELENYVLLLSKIPLIPNTNDVDDFAVSLDLVQATQQAIDEGAPSLVWSAYTPCDVEVIRFDKNDQSETDVLSQSIHNFFANSGVSEIIFNSDSQNSAAISAGIKGDELTCFKFLARLEANMQRYVRLNISEDFAFKFHMVTYFSKKEYLDELREKATTGLPAKLDYATATGDTPFEVMNKTYMENALNLSSLWVPLSTSYTQSSGAPVKDESELSDEGMRTRDANKNG